MNELHPLSTFVILILFFLEAALVFVGWFRAVFLEVAQKGKRG